tara:strand:- start:1342 stop:2118 length:777 start_codon:yes stop_codon:yes gene_type:complete
MYRFSRIGLRLAADQRGITGLETAIVLIAFVVVASVFAFTVLTTGLFTSKEAEKSSRAAITSAEATMVRVGSIVAGGACLQLPPGNCVNDGSGAVDWINCGATGTDPDRRPVDNGVCAGHAQLLRFKLTPGGDVPVEFDPESVDIYYYDTGAISGDRGPISIKLGLDQTTPLAQGEAGAQACINNNSGWCFRWEAGETDKVLQVGETVEIFIGATQGQIHQLEKHTVIAIEVILPDGAVVVLNAKMPPVIFQVMDISS